MSEIARLLAAHHNNMVAEMGSAVVGNSGVLNWTGNLAAKAGVNKGTVAGVLGIGILAVWLKHKGLINLTGRVTDLTQQNQGVKGHLSRVSKSNEELQKAFNKGIQALLSKIDQMEERIVEAKEMKEVLERLKSDQDLLFKAEAEKREELLEVFKEIREENPENEKMIDEKIAKTGKAHAKFLEDARNIMSPVSRLLERLIGIKTDANRISSIVMEAARGSRKS